MDPNGQWTLFVADVSPLRVSTLAGWGLTIDVPEPSVAVIGALGLWVAIMMGVRRARAGDEG